MDELIERWIFYLNSIGLSSDDWKLCRNSHVFLRFIFSQPDTEPRVSKDSFCHPSFIEYFLALKLAAVTWAFMEMSPSDFLCVISEKVIFTCLQKIKLSRQFPYSETSYGLAVSQNWFRDIFKRIIFNQSSFVKSPLEDGQLGLNFLVFKSKKFHTFFRN